MNDTSGQDQQTPNNPGDKQRKQAMMILGALTIVFFVGGALLVSETDEMKIPSARVKRGPVTIKITEVGELQARDQVTISAVNDKKLVWLVPEGQWVEEGDTLLQMEWEKYFISRNEAESSVQVAKAEWKKALGDLGAQKAKEQSARQNYESLPELAEKGFVMESEVEQARLAYMELKSKTNSYRAGVEAARANLERAKRSLAQHEIKVSQGVQVAPRAGLVVYATVGSEESQKKIEVGMTPFEGQELMYLPDISSMQVKTEISEVDLSRIKLGLPVEIRLDAYPDAVFKGEVAKISDLARRKISRVTGRPTGAKVFDVTVRVLDRDLRLKPGLTATVDIVVDEYDNVLYLPLESIFIDEQDQTFVYVRNDGNIEARIVSIGDSNDRVAMIQEGLKEGEEILLARPKSG